MIPLTRIVTKTVVKTRIVKDKDGNDIEEEYTVIEPVVENLSPEEEAEIRTEWAKNDEEVAKNKYLSDRRREYLSVEKQLEYMQENGFEAWQQFIQAIKDKYPKPT